MSQYDNRNALVPAPEVNRIEFLSPNNDGVETFNYAGLDVSIDKNARTKFDIYTAKDEIILVRAGVEAQQIKNALNQAMGTDGHINPSDFLSRATEIPLPVGTPPQRTIDVIFVENRKAQGSDETSRVTHVQRGDPKLSRLQTEINGTDSQYVIAERSLESRTEKTTQWQMEQMSQGKTRTVIFVEGDPSISAKLTGGNRLSLSDKRTFPVGGSRIYGPDFEKPLMHIVTEADVKGQSIPAAEITTRINRVTQGVSQGVIVIR